MIPGRGSLVAAALAAMAVLASGCSSPKEGTPIARVGDAVLTLEAARAEVDTSAAGFDGRLQRYVTGWVNSELLYQEAVSRGIGTTPEFEAKIAAVRRQLANQELLDLLIYGRDTTLSPDTLRAYFDRHRDEFTLTEDHLKARLMTFRARENARRFAAAVIAKKSWQAAADSIASDSAAGAGVVSSVPATWFTRATLYPPELWKVASPLVPGEVSFPFKTETGFTVLQYVAFAPAGKTGEYELAEADVRDRVRIERDRAALETLLGTLRERYGVEMMMNNEGTPRNNEN
jgi:hypothetical protein